MVSRRHRIKHYVHVHVNTTTPEIDEVCKVWRSNKIKCTYFIVKDNEAVVSIRPSDFDSRPVQDFIRDNPFITRIDNEPV